MPGGDGTGPLGMGPMTGRRMGNCVSAGTTSYGYGRGLGIRRGFRSFYNPGVFESKQSLQNRADYLKRSLEDIQRQLDSYEDDE